MWSSSAQSLQNQPDRYVTYYQRIVSTLATITMPISLSGAAEADFLIRTFLGSQWLGAISVFRILRPGRINVSVKRYARDGYDDHGISSLRFACWGFTNALLYIAAFVAGLPFGIEGIATGFLVATYVIGFTSIFYCFRETPISVTQFLAAQISPFVTSLLATSGLLLAQQLWPSNSITDVLVRFIIFWAICIGESFCRKSIRESAVFILREFACSPGGQGPKL